MAVAMTRDPVADPSGGFQAPDIYSSKTSSSLVRIIIIERERLIYLFQLLVLSQRVRDLHTLGQNNQSVFLKQLQLKTMQSVSLKVAFHKLLTIICWNFPSIIPSDRSGVTESGSQVMEWFKLLNGGLRFSLRIFYVFIYQREVFRLTQLWLEFSNKLTEECE